MLRDARFWGVLASLLFAAAVVGVLLANGQPDHPKVEQPPKVMRIVTAYFEREGFEHIQVWDYQLSTVDVCLQMAYIFEPSDRPEGYKPDPNNYIDVACIADTNRDWSRWHPPVVEGRKFEPGWQEYFDGKGDRPL